MSSRFPDAWLRGDPAATALLRRHFREPRERATAVDEAAGRPVSAGLLGALSRQNGTLARSPERERHLAALAEPGTVVVATGQQVGLLLGPAYTVHKAWSVVAVARALAAETGRRVVPVFWLQTEDHDRPEIAGCALPSGTGEPLRLTLPDDGLSARISVGGRRLGPAIADVLDAVSGALRGLPHADDVMELLTRHYRPEATFAQAFAGVLGALFADEGLVILDPSDPDVARLAMPLHDRALREAGAIADALTTRAAAITAAGFHVQVHVRPGAPLAFFHPDGPTGPRSRLVPQEAGYRLLGHEGPPIGVAALLAALRTEPRSFSTSALLRPLLQDTLLPVAAYVGGPGEATYFAQLEPLYAHFGRSVPMFVLRARFRWLSAKDRVYLAEAGLQPADLAAPLDALLPRLATAQGPVSPDALRARLLHPFAEALEAIRAPIAALDPGLAKATDRTAAAVEDAVERLAGKVGRALAQREGAAVARLTRIRGELYPGGAAAERVYSIVTQAARHGVPALKRCLGSWPVYHPDPLDLSP